jgi:hypothetical protein
MEQALAAQMSTRVLSRPKRAAPAISPLSLHMLDEIEAQRAAERSRHSSDWDSNYSLDGGSYDPIWGNTPSPSGDNWGRSLPSPAQGPQTTGKNHWYNREKPR